MLGIPAKSLRQVLKTSTSDVPCVYVFALGRAQDLCKEMNLPATTPDDHIIINFGLTDNLDRRTGEHLHDYGKIPKVTLELLRYCHAPPEAERERK